jgi:poly(hydroxyalkanoate) depolymerase family esterase
MESMLRFLRGWLGRRRGRTALPAPPPAPPPAPTPSGPPTRPGAAPGRVVAGTFTDPHGTGRILRRRGRDLGYQLYWPAAAVRPAAPLLVMLHGCEQDAAAFAGGTRMNAHAERHGVAVLYPEQSRDANPMRCWNWFDAHALAGDGEAALLARLIRHVADHRPVDVDRIYVVGMSAGGAMASVLAARHAALFAGCGVHSGLMFGAAASPLQALDAMRAGPTAAAIERAGRRLREAADAEGPVPTIVVHGDGDPLVNPVNAARLADQWTARAGAHDGRDGPLVVARERRVDGDGRAYVEQDILRRGRLVFRRVLVEGLGHAWSGGDPDYGFNDAPGPDASRLMLEFLLPQRRPTRRGRGRGRGRDASQAEGTKS